MPEFRLPDPGEGLVEATIIQWKVAVGDTVRTNDIVVEVETAKSLVELPIPWDGTVTQILAQEGDEVEVGTPIIVIDNGDGAGGDGPATGTTADDTVDTPAEAGMAAPGEVARDAAAVDAATDHQHVHLVVVVGPRGRRVGVGAGQGHRGCEGRVALSMLAR